MVNRVGKSKLLKKLVVPSLLPLPLLLVIAPSLSSLFIVTQPIPVYAQTGSKVRSLTCDFVQEEGCPVTPGNLRCDVELDPFDTPTSPKIYFDYKNSSSKAISAVKFRVRFVDGEGNDKGTFHAVDSFYLQPSGDRTQKWKRDVAIHPGVTALKIRVLQVKYADGESWESVKMQELVGGNPAAAGGGGAGSAPGLSE